MINWEEILGDLEQIGIVASPSGENEAFCVLQEGKEKVVTSETIVLIDNRNGNKVLAVCRGGQGTNDALRYSYYTPAIAYAKSGRGPSTAKEFFGYRLVVIGDVTNGTIRQNNLIIAPGSYVYRFDERYNPMSFLGNSRHKIGYHATGYKTWEVPVLAEYIPHHIGIFGVTGSGKSYFCRYRLIPLLREAGYDIMIFDWKGSDYAPYYPGRVISMGDIELDELSVYLYLKEKFGNFGGGYYGERLCEYLEEVITAREWKGRDAQETKRVLLEEIKKVIQENSASIKNPHSYIKRAEKYITRVSDEDLLPVLGSMSPSDIVARLREEHVLVIDQSYGSKEQKLSIFLSITRYLKDLMEEKNTLNVALIVDEAPQYCPYQPRGFEEETTKMITSLAALGRSYGLSLTLIAQGIAGEIGINAAVRRNLNTLFVGRIHPLDAQEAEKFFANSWVTSNSLLRLPEGQFYMMGKMNPSPVPLLITFDIPESEKIGATR